MKNIFLSLSAMALSLSACAQVPHARTTTVEVDGNCGMCETTIEKAAFVKGEASADWNKDTKQAVLNFDSTRTTEDAVLKRIALAGYDNAKYLAPDAAYAALPGCCQYDRARKHPVVHGNEAHAAETPAKHHEHTAPAVAQQQNDPLDPVFTAYFRLKDALVASDAAQAKDQGLALKHAVDAVDMSALGHDVHTAWMKVVEPLANLSGTIATTGKLDDQRKAFMQLTAPMGNLAKAAPGAVPVYIAHCPMYQGGADWLSLEKDIKNPFYGNQMLTCASVKETIVK
jgi:copper chaperone CopZ